MLYSRPTIYGTSTDLYSSSICIGSIESLVYTFMSRPTRLHTQEHHWFMILNSSTLDQTSRAAAPRAF